MEQPKSHWDLVTSAILGDTFLHATFAGVIRGPAHAPWQRVTIRPLQLRGQPRLQFSYFDARKDITHNYAPAEALAKLHELLAIGFSGIHIATRDEEIDIRLSKKGHAMIGRRKAAHPAPPASPQHNRIKDLPLPEGRADRVLQIMGIMTADGRVRPTMRPKFTQINEFLKLLAHVLREEFPAAAPPSSALPLRILDCGCGSAYLTIATHHYLSDILGLPAQVIGVDINEEVIRKSIAKTERLLGKAGEEAGGAGRGGGVAFVHQPIGQADIPADIVLGLHACDTATDDAIAQAIRSHARILMCVPCCHHDLSGHIAPAGEAAPLQPILRHGILRQRTADLVTDAFRALALRIAGYRADVIEFVSPEHTTRNLMIRAVRTDLPDPRARDEWAALKKFWHVTPYLERAGLITPEPNTPQTTPTEIQK